MGSPYNLKKLENKKRVITSKRTGGRYLGMTSNVVVNHNGYKIQHYDKMDEAFYYIDEVLNQYRHLNPQKIFDRTMDGNKATKHKHTRIIRYMYNTLYEEVFIIDFN